MIQKQLGTLVVILVLCAPAKAQQSKRPSVEHFSPPAKPSKIPQYVFGDTLEEQEQQLAENPYLKRLHHARAKQANDPHRPIYHYVNPEGRLNDPNGLCFGRGVGTFSIRLIRLRTLVNIGAMR